jgi:hypothetical protein
VERIKFSKLNLGQINELVLDHKLVSNELFKRLDKVIILRNKQHLGSLEKIESNYSKKDVEFVFSVAKDVTILAEKII